MKRILLAGTACALFASVLVSCGENKETSTETETTTTTTTESELPADDGAAAASVSDAPTFSDEEVNKGLAEYKALIDEYAAAVKEKNQAKIAELTTKAQEASQNMQSWMTKLKPEETQKFTEYTQQLSQEWSNAANAAMGQ